MRDRRDAWGHALRDYLDGKGRAYVVIERADGYADVSGEREYLADYQHWPSRQRQAVRYARGRVLDVGCGTGRHAFYLQAQGLDVLGIDTSPVAVAVCRRRGLKYVRLMSFDQVSPALGAFGTVLMLGANLGLLANRDKARRLLRRLHDITEQDGRIIAESHDPYQTDNPFHRAYQRRNKQRGRMAGRVRIRVRYHKYVTPWFDYLFVSRNEMARILCGTGWAVRRFVPPHGALYVAVIVKDD